MRLTIVAVGAAGEGDAGAGGSEHFGVGAAAGGEEFAAVDHRGGQAAVVDHRSGARAPGGSGRGLEQFGGMVADELEGVAPFDEADALVDQAFELDRLDLGAVLLGLAAALRLLVGVELALDAVDLAVEQVDERPQEIGEIVLEPGAGQHGAEGLDRGVELGLDGVGLGQRPRIGLVLAGAVAVEREFVEQMRGRRGGVEFGIGVAVGEGEGAVVAGHGGCLSCRRFQPRPSRPSRRSLAGGGDGLHPQGRSSSGGWRGATILLRDAKPPLGRRRKIVVPRHCNPAQGGPGFAGPPGASGRSPLGKAAARPFSGRRRQPRHERQPTPHSGATPGERKVTPSRCGSTR